MRKKEIKGDRKGKKRQIDIDKETERHKSRGESVNSHYKHVFKH